MSNFEVLVDGTKQTVAPGTDGFGLFTSKTVVAQRVNGQLKDLAYKAQEGDSIEGVEIASEDGLNILRHSTAHVLAQAVQNINPEAKLGIGPPIKDGFYYDF
ncbi:MAG: threonine--tRNA ligase, partial [Actinomycetota bacterium]